jgi:hypothetical protein
MKVVLSQRKKTALLDEEGRMFTYLEMDASGQHKWRCKTRPTCKAVLITTTRPSEDDIDSGVPSVMLVG